MMNARAALCLLALAGAALVARAESTDTDSVTLGAMTEHADAVVVAEAAAAPAEGDVWSFHVGETLRGVKPEPPADVRVLLSRRADSGDAPLRANTPYLLFLRARDGSSGVYEPLARPWGVRDTTEGEVKPLLDYTRRYAATIAPDGSVAKPSALLALLVESLDSTASGVPSCAGRDLVRHEELVGQMTPAQRQAVDAALARPRKGDMDLAAIVDAVGVAGTGAADAALVARLVDPATRGLRLDLTSAMRRHARPALVAMLAAKLDGATPQQRADVVNALGRLDLRDAEPFLVTALADAEPDVRVEAAHSVGLLARAVRAPKDGVDADAPREKLSDALAPLVAAVALAKSEHEKRALCWAVAQIDTPEAWAELRKLRDEAADARVREIATGYVLHPRVDLILE